MPAMPSLHGSRTLLIRGLVDWLSSACEVPLLAAPRASPTVFTTRPIACPSAGFSKGRGVGGDRDGAHRLERGLA